MGWLIALAILVLLAILPLGVSAIYDSSGAVVKVIAGPIRLTVYPGKKKAKKKKESKKKQTKTQTQSTQSSSQQKTDKKGSWTDFLPIVQTVLDLLGDFGRKLRVDLLEMNLILAGDDPCDLAVNYGRAWTALGNLWPQLERLFVIKKRNVQIQCDFEADATKVTARLDLTITLGRLLYLVVRYGVRALIQYLNIMKSRKGGASI